MMKDEFLEVSGRRIRIFIEGDPGPVVIVPVFDTPSESPDEIVKDTESLLPQGTGHCVVFVFIASWDDDLSPWRTVAADRSFGEGGRDLLEWMEGSLVPFLWERFGAISTAVSGYSLAGLFALWACYESDIFDGCGCCSGSLWFEGWDGYADSRRIRPGTAVYLSLGGKEPGSGRPPMSDIGGCYDRQRKRVRGYDVVARFESNPGGHFSNVPMRIAKSVSWIVQVLSGRR